MNLQRSRIIRLVRFKIRITDQGVGPAWQRQSRARAERDSLVLFGLIFLKSYSPFTSINYLVCIFLKKKSTYKLYKRCISICLVPANHSQTRPGISHYSLSELSLLGRGHVLVRCFHIDTGLWPLFLFLPFWDLLWNSLVPFTL